MTEPADRAPVRVTAWICALLFAPLASAQAPPLAPVRPAAAAPASPSAPFAPSSPFAPPVPAVPVAPKPASASAADASLGQLAWLRGCWRGSVNQREFREHWLPLRGELMVGAGHTVNAGRTQDFEYLRLERRTDGVYYVASPSAQKPAVFRLAELSAEGPDTVFTFRNVAQEFPATILYRRASGGWLYVQLEGKVGSEERKVIYPFRRVDCESDAFIEQ